MPKLASQTSGSSSHLFSVEILCGRYTSLGHAVERLRRAGWLCDVMICVPLLFSLRPDSSWTCRRYCKPPHLCCETIDSITWVALEMPCVLTHIHRSGNTAVILRLMRRRVERR